MKNPEAQRGMDKAGFKPYQPGPIAVPMMAYALRAISPSAGARTVGSWAGRKQHLVGACIY